MSDAKDVLVSTQWLADNLHTANVRVVECSWYLPDQNRDGQSEYEAQHVPGAVRFDIEAIADHSRPGAHMLPSAELFAEKVGQLGIDNQTLVVVYDTSYVAARVWWMFRAFGHENVAVLDGGLTKWLSEGHPVERGTVSVGPRAFAAHPRPELVADWRGVLSNLSGNAAQLVDARTAKRYSGEMPSGYPGIRAGHIPGSINLPWDAIENPKTQQFLSLEALATRLASAGVDVEQPVVITCGSGITACIIALSLHRLGRNDWKVYDGSWYEWAQLPDVPRVWGAAG